MDKQQAVVSKLAKYKELVSLSGIHIGAMYLFGSHAEGRATKDSDIDVAIVSNDFSGSRYYDSLKLSKIRNAVDVTIEPIAYRTDDFIMEDPLVSQIVKTGIKI